MPNKPGVLSGFSDGAFARVVVNIALAQACLYATRPALSYVAVDQGGGPVEVGILATAFGLGPVAVAIPVGRWIDRRGERSFLITGMTTMSAGVALLTVVDAFPLIALATLVFGMGHLLIAVSSQSLASRRVGRERDQRLALYTLFGSLGQLSGPLIGGLVITYVTVLEPTRAPFVAATVLGVVGAVLMLSIRRGSTPPGGGAAPDQASPAAPISAGVPRSGVRPPRRSALALLRTPGMTASMLACMAVSSGLDVVLVFMPLLGEARGISPAMVGVVLSVRAGAMLVSRLFVTPALTVLGHRRALAGGMAAASVGCAALVVDLPLPWLLLAMILIGFGLGISQPINMSLIASRAGADQALAAALWFSASRLSIAVIPLLAGLLAGQAGLVAVYATMAVWLGLSGLATLVQRDPRF